MRPCQQKHRKHPAGGCSGPTTARRASQNRKSLSFWRLESLSAALAAALRFCCRALAATMSLKSSLGAALPCCCCCIRSCGPGTLHRCMRLHVPYYLGGGRYAVMKRFWLPNDGCAMLQFRTSLSRDSVPQLHNIHSGLVGPQLEQHSGLAA